jgi:plasmid replication initiation protein
MKSIGESIGEAFGAVGAGGVVGKKVETVKRKRSQAEVAADVKAKTDAALARMAASSAAGGTVAPAPVQAANSVLSILSPIRHPQMDFFVADIFDASFKDDMASMEHPLFALKAGDKRIRIYERNGNTVTVKPGYDGRATINDKDVWIYCTSQLVEAINRGRNDVSRTVRFTAHDFLITTNRPVDGDSYKRMGDAIARLSATRIETNIETAGVRDRRGFGLVDSWRVIERDKDKRMVAIEVTLPDWLYRSIVAKQVLTLHRDYFRLRKPLDRRIYELARKHCGTQKKWVVSVRVLFEKSGSTDALRNFRGALKTLAESDQLPDYRLALDSQADTVTFFRR